MATLELAEFICESPVEWFDKVVGMCFFYSNYLLQSRKYFLFYGNQTLLVFTTLDVSIRNRPIWVRPSGHQKHLLNEDRKQVLLKDSTCELLLESAVPIN